MLDDAVEEFEGFDPYFDDNWFRFPNILIDKVLWNLGRGELVILIYIMRNTVGYNDVFKRITLDEFEFGRKKKDGSRLDHGTGLGRSTIIRSLKTLMDKKFIQRMSDTTDLGRAKHYYALRHKGEPGEVFLSQGCQNDTPDIGAIENTQGCQNNTPTVPQRTPVQRNTPIRNTPIEKESVPTPAECGTPSSSEVVTSKKQPSPFDVKACNHFITTLQTANVKVPKGNVAKWCQQFRLLRERNGATQADIKQVLLWYRDYYPNQKGDQYTVVCHSAQSFREKFFDKLLPRSQAQHRQTTSTVNGIKEITVRDVAKAHQRDPDWGSTYLFTDYADWKVGKYRKDPEAHFQQMADLANDARQDNPRLVRAQLEQVGLGYLLVKHED